MTTKKKPTRGQPQRYVAFLRGINLGKRRLAMSRLKVLFEELGFDEVETFIASGNVLFTTAVEDTARLESEIATHLEKSLGYDVDTFVRALAVVKTIADRKAFPEDGEEGITVHVGFLQKPLALEISRKLTAVRTAEDEFRVSGCEYYWLCRVRTSDSKVWTLPEVRALRLPSSTMRNMTSIRKLVSKHCV